MNADQNPSDTSLNSEGKQQKPDSKPNDDHSSHSGEIPTTSQEGIADYLPENLLSELTIKSSIKSAPDRLSENSLHRVSSGNVRKWIVGLISAFSRSKFFNNGHDKSSLDIQESTRIETGENSTAVRVFSRVSIRVEQESSPKQSNEHPATSSNQLQTVPEVTNLLYQRTASTVQTAILEQPRIQTETRELYVSQTPLIESQSNTQLTPLGRSFSHEILPSIPPSYSTVIKFPPPEQRRPPRIHTESEFSFSTRIPPPSYAQVQGLWTDSTSTRSSEDILYGPEPQYATCPNCTVVVLTETRNSITKLTHFTAIGLCLLGCWPCCLLPYFMASCKETYHYCPVCHYCFGLYSPW